MRSIFWRLRLTTLRAVAPGDDLDKSGVKDSAANCPRSGSNDIVIRRCVIGWCTATTRPLINAHRKLQEQVGAHIIIIQDVITTFCHMVENWGNAPQFSVV